MRISRKVAATGLAAAAMTVGALATTVGTASAATYNGVCGIGYGVVNSAPVGNVGTVFLTYSSSTGKNCVVTIRNTPGTAIYMDAGLKRSSDPTWIWDHGNFTTYAGPKYVSAPGVCVDWFGTIGSVRVVRYGTNCS